MLEGPRRRMWREVRSEDEEDGMPGKEQEEEGGGRR